MITPGVCSTIAAAGGLGPELVTNGTFDDSSGWSTAESNPPVPLISGGTLNFSASPANGRNIKRAAVSVVNGATYRVSIAYSGTNRVGDSGFLVSSPGGDIAIPAGSGTLTQNIAATSTSFQPTVLVSSDGESGDFSGTFDNYSVRRVN